MNLQKLKDAVALVNAFIAENESSSGSYTKKPLPLHAKAAYDACRQMWEAADMARRSGEIGAPDFDKFRYIGGILPGGQVRIPEKGPSEMQADIVALGHSVWGQQWLSNDSNAAQIDPDYLRHFLGYRVVRKAQNDESQGYNRVP